MTRPTTARPLDSYGQLVDELRDDATGLFNWALLQDRLEHALIRGARRAQVTAVGLIHMEQPAEGVWPPDWRRHVGEAIRRILRAEDSIGVAPEGLFAVVLEDVTGAAGAAVAIRRVLIAVEHAEHEMGAACPTRVGLAVAVPPFEDAAVLLLQAEVALVRAMSRSETTFVIFDEALDGPTFKRALDGNG